MTTITDRAPRTTELVLDQCKIPKGRVLGEVGKGYKIAIETLNEGRIGIGAQMIGISQAALDYSARYTKERHQFGKPIASFQLTQRKLVDMMIGIYRGMLVALHLGR